MKKILTLLSLLPIKICLAASSTPLVIISDEFDSKGELSSSLSSSLYIKNSSDFYKRTMNEFDYLEYINENYNYLTLTPSIRYGLNNSLLLTGGFTVSYNNYSAKENNTGEYYSNNDTKFDNISMGLLYKLKSENEWNKVIGLNFIAYEKLGMKDYYFKTINTRILFNKTFDPLVTSLDIGFQYSQDYDINGIKYQPSNYIYLKPKINFLANNLFAIGIGTELKVRSKEKLDNYIINSDLLENNILFSISHTMSAKKRWYFESSFDTSGHAGGSLSLGIDFDY